MSDAIGLYHNTAGSIETYTGKFFPVLSPSPRHVDIEDIVHALSNICRYNGHSIQFYSVLHHSILVHDYLKERGHSGKLLLVALLHDAAEAYTGDCTRPLKYSEEMYQYRVAYDRVEDAVFAAFDLTTKWEHPDEWKLIKIADNAVLMAEAKRFMATKGKDWAFGGAEPAKIPWWKWQVYRVPFVCRLGFMRRYRAAMRATS
jgi:hypothetical protein